MSATEVTAEPTTKLPENPIDVIVEATTVPQSIAVVHDEEIASTVQAAKTLESVGSQGASKAGEYFSAQSHSESSADKSYAGASTADSEEVYNAHAGQAETHLAEAGEYNAKGHSTMVSSTEADAKSAALQRIAVVQKAGQEIAERTELSVHQEANRTAEGVKQEMKVLAAVEDDASTAQNLEGELKVTAESTLKV